MDWDDFREKEENDYFIEALKRMAETHERLVLEESELVLAITPDPTSTPMPNTAHPSLERHARFVRGLGQDHVRIPKPLNRRWLRADMDATYPVELEDPTFHMHAKRCWGEAAFVGDPLNEKYYYEWLVWFDDYGRHIASESTLRYIQR